MSEKQPKNTSVSEAIATLVVLGVLVIYITFASYQSQVKTELYRPTPTMRATRTRVPTRTPVATRTRAPSRTPTWTSTRTSIWTPTWTSTWTPTRTVTPTITQTPIPTSTQLPSLTPVLGYSLPINLNPAAGIPDKAVVSQIMRADDVILAWAGNIGILDQFPKQTTNQGALLNINNDGYPDRIPEAIAAFLAECEAHGVDRIYYNVEWSVPFTSHMARLRAVTEELDRQGNTLPVLWVPIYSIFVNYSGEALPLFDGAGIQLQNQAIGSEGALTADAVARVNNTLDNAWIEIQIGCSPYYRGRTYEQVLTAAYEVESVEGVTALSLWYGQDWAWCSQVVEELR